MKRLILIVGSLLLTTAGALAQGRSSPNLGEQNSVEIEVRRWDSGLNSELRLSGGGIPGVSLDPTRDLRLPDERTWDYRGQIRFGRFKARGSWFKTKYESTVAPNEPLSFIGLAVPPGQSLETQMELEELRIGLEVNLIEGQYAFFAVIGEWARLETRPFAQSGGASVTGETLELQLPVFGVKGRTYLTPALAVTVEGTGMQRESEGVMTNFEAVATYNASPNIALSYGYRNAYNRFKSIEPAGDRAVVRLTGQFIGVTVRF